MTDLLIDIGNSRIKWAWSENGAIAGFSHAVDVQALDSIVRSRRPDRVAIAATGHEATAARLTAEVEQAWPDVRVQRARTQSRSGRLVNSYQDAAAMGVDRWLAMLAACAEAPDQPLLVVDAGTAVTIDAVAADGRHLGGWIAPGLELMRASLARDTARIGLEQVPPTLGQWGTDTGSAVHAGTQGALVGMVELACRGLTDSESDLAVFLTGGNAPELLSLLNLPTADVRHEPVLVLQGLKHWLDTEFG